jgi:hypothetical protein
MQIFVFCFVGFFTHFLLSYYCTGGTSWYVFGFDTRSHYLAHVGLNPPASTSQVLGLQACIAMPGFVERKSPKFTLKKLPIERMKDEGQRYWEKSYASLNIPCFVNLTLEPHKYFTQL